MTQSLYPFFGAKPYPTGYKVPPIFEHYQGIPCLDMPPFEKSETLVSPLPEVFMIRATVQEDLYDTWPSLTLPFGGSLSLERLDLYTAEGQRLIQEKRLRSLTLLFEGLCLIPYGDHALLPWEPGQSLLPLKKGEFLGTQNFSIAPDVIAATIPSTVFPFGGLMENHTRPLLSKPLYFFVEQGEGTSLPQIKLLFEEDLEALKRMPDCPLVLLDSTSPSSSLERLLTEGLYQITLNDPQKTVYKAIGITPVNHKGHLIDIVMMRI